MKYNESFEARLHARYDELKWLYIELYGRYDRLEKLVRGMRAFADVRSEPLRALDEKRVRDSEWYRASGMLGLTLYTDLFAGDLKGLMGKIDYLTEMGVTYLHLMPLMKMPHPDNDGGYAVEDFARVDEALGSNEDLEQLTALLRERGISLCLDFVINHTADTHAWAMRAKAGEQAYVGRYICYDSYDVPAQYERTVPQVFPDTAPGNFTWNEQMKKYVLTTFNRYQWDLNYKNPEVFNEMAFAMLNLANMGVEVFRVDAVPYIWKELGTNCRNLPRVHTVMRMMRLIIECVCPAVILKGEVVMAPHEVAAYFGTGAKPECHLLYNVSGMVNLWAALAMRDARPLKMQLDAIHSLGGGVTFVNYLRCHDDIGWGLDEGAIRYIGLDPQKTKEYLYNFYSGNFPDSFARGETYNFDPETLDARSCGTTASLTGLERAMDMNDEAEKETALKRNLMMHAAMMSLAGFPMLSSGDEIGQLNDYRYKADPARAHDSRNLHRSTFDWKRAALRKEPGSVQQRIFSGLRAIEKERARHRCFDKRAYVSTWDSSNRAVLALVRAMDGERLVCLYNFSDYYQTAVLNALEGEYTDLFTGRAFDGRSISLAPYEFGWFSRNAARG